jgi:8-oxo-dGTP diphosphatase
MPRHGPRVLSERPPAGPRAERGDPLVHSTSTALIVREGRVLLGKRTSRVRFAGMWDAFGGHREEGETPAHALVRELFEELGIRITAARFLHEYEDRDPTSKERYHHHLYLVTDWRGTPRIANDEHSEIRWFSAAELAKVKLQPHLKKVAREVLAKNV